MSDACKIQQIEAMSTRLLAQFLYSCTYNIIIRKQLDVYESHEEMCKAGEAENPEDLLFAACLIMFLMP